MLTLQELQDYLNDQKTLLVDIFIIHKNILRFQEDKYEYETQIKEHGFFEALGAHLKFVLCIQLSKLYGTNKNTDKRSFAKLCNKLENSDFDVPLVNQIKANKENTADIIKSKGEAKQLVKTIMELLKDKEDVIKRLIIARDQVYAHTDPKPEKFKISWQELTELVNLAGEIYNLFSFKLFFNTTIFKEVRDWDIDYVFRHISNSKKVDALERERKLKGLI